MVSNSSGFMAGYLAGTFPGRVGWLLSPRGWRKPTEWHVFALDNGAFTGFDEKEFFGMLSKLDKLVPYRDPLWVTVPDKLKDREETRRLWDVYSPILRSRLDCPLAFVVQDGMTPSDVPKSADLIFVGGSKDWKWDSLEMWTTHFPWVHVGRVNSPKKLWVCHQYGVASCDGTGWFRGDRTQLEGLWDYLEATS